MNLSEHCRFAAEFFESLAEHVSVHTNVPGAESPANLLQIAMRKQYADCASGLREAADLLANRWHSSALENSDNKDQH